MIYLDYNATTPVDENVLQEMLPYFTTQFGNASSATHVYGLQARKAVDNAREKIAAHLHADAQEIIFTSGATEAVNLAVKGLYGIYGGKKKHIITVATEHSAVMDTCKSLEEKGAELTVLPVDSHGLLDMESLQSAIREDTLLIAVMYANNETGVLQPIKIIGNICKQKNVFFFCDATQAVGKLPMNVQDENIDLLCFSGHKMYGPKGIGGLYVRRKSPRVNLAAQVHGGGHERGWRSGTLNVPGIVGLGKSLDIFHEEETKRIEALRDTLENALLGVEGVLLNGHRQRRIFNVCNLSFKKVSGKRLIAELSKEMAVSAGSACSAESNMPSHVLTAMGVPEDMAKSSVRFSLGRFTTGEEIKFAIDFIKEVYARLRDQ